MNNKDGPSKLQIIERPLQKYVDDLANGKFYTFMKYGDGEFGTMIYMDKDHKNQEGCGYFPEIGTRMKQSLLNNHSGNFMYSISYVTINDFGNAVDKLLESNDINLKWWNAGVFHWAIRDGQFLPMTNQLKKMRTVFIGPKFVRGVNRLFDYVDYVEVPRRDAALKSDEIANDIRKMWEKHKPEVFAFCAGFATNIVADILFPELGDKCFMIDYGAAFDPVCGQKTRGYMRKMSEHKLMQNNYGLKTCKP